MLLIGCFGSMSDAISADTLSFSAVMERLNVPGPLGPCIASVHSPRNGAASATDTVFGVPCTPDATSPPRTTGTSASTNTTTAIARSDALIIRPPRNTRGRPRRKTSICAERAGACAIVRFGRRQLRLYRAAPTDEAHEGSSAVGCWRLVAGGSLWEVGCEVFQPPTSNLQPPTSNLLRIHPPASARAPARGAAAPAAVPPRDAPALQRRPRSLPRPRARRPRSAARFQPAGSWRI